MPLKTAQELGLSEDQRCALIKALEALEAGRLKKDFDIHFNMGSWGGECGTVCCIGGSAEALGELRYGELARRATNLAQQGKWDLHRLFYPGTNPYTNWAWGATQEQAAKALRHYLTTGKEGWNEANGR